MELEKKKILIIDDDTMLLVSTKALLEEEGYDAKIHQGWFGATVAIKNYRPDLVLLDINMPGLSGDKLAELILSSNGTKDARIVFYSSNDEDSMRKSVAKFGVRGYICKGDIFSLRKKVSDFIG